MLCPKCHQPIEGEEAYICCAQSLVQWHCQDCGKVSEGFAFPYGMCPYCNGKLELIGDRELEDEAALAAIRTAFEIELGGQAFYTRASNESEDPTLKDLFGRFAAMEGEHMETLAKRYHAQVSPPSRDFSLDRAAIYAGLEKNPNDPASLFRIAIAFEERAVAYFTQRSADSAADSVERQLYKELAAEEREHVAILTTEFDRWKAGKPGLL